MGNKRSSQDDGQATFKFDATVKPQERVRSGATDNIVSAHDYRLKSHTKKAIEALGRQGLIIGSDKRSKE